MLPNSVAADSQLLAVHAPGIDAPELLDAFTGKQKCGVVLVTKAARNALEWDGPENAPTPEQVAERLRPHIGRTPFGELHNVEIGVRHAN
jgi:hypothetical protein